ncbi:meteorin-like protein [Ditylenchus destructor]|nr:meteorin-like protein [Ditylenchus destructor]
MDVDGNAFLSADPCSVLVSGGPIRASVVRTVYLNCEQGALFWNQPAGSLLVRFAPSLLESLVDNNPTRSHRLCLRFPEEHSPQVSVHKMVNTRLEEEIQLSDTTVNQLHCTEIAPNRTVYLYMKSELSNGAKPSSAGFYYIIEETPTSSDVECGKCSEEQFLQAYCSSNFVLRSRFLREMPQGNALEFSVTNILRSPAFLGNIISTVRPKSGIRTATLLSRCPKDSVSYPPFHSEFIVVGDAQIGVARLSCMLHLDVFRRLTRSQENKAPCELKEY